MSGALQPRSTSTSVWAGPRSLAATYGIILIFFSWGYLDGSVLPVRLLTLCIQIRIPLKWWVFPFGNLRINARLTAPRSLSQPSTSFIASYCQGIRRIHLKNYGAIYFVLKIRVGVTQLPIINYKRPKPFRINYEPLLLEICN